MLSKPRTHARFRTIHLHASLGRVGEPVGCLIQIVAVTGHQRTATAIEFLLNAFGVNNGTSRHLVAGSGHTLTARTSPVIVDPKGYEGLLVVGGSSGTGPAPRPAAAHDIVGRRYYGGAGHSWDLNFDNWILAATLEYANGNAQVVGGSRAPAW